MPFDAADFVGSVADLGVVPLSAEMVERYKKNVLRRYKRWSIMKNMMVAEGRSGWRQSPWRLLPKHSYELYSPFLFTDSSSAPDAVYDAAVAFKQAHPDAQFRIHAFDVDPILEARTRGRETAFIGAWADGKTLAVAGVNGKQPHYTPEFRRSARRTLWDRLLRR